MPSSDRAPATSCDIGTVCGQTREVTTPHSDRGAGKDATAIAMSPNGRILAVGTVDGDVDLADPTTYAVEHRLHADGAVSDPAFSIDGTRLAAVGASRRLDVWNTATGNPTLTKPPSFPGAGISVRWLNDSHTLIYGGDDGQALLFDTDAGVQVGVSLPVYQDSGAGEVRIAPVQNNRLALLPGYRLIGQTRQGVAYSLDPADWLAYACAVVQRDLTHAEWTNNVPDQPYRPTCTDLNSGANP